MEVATFIYGLKDPRTNKRRYVGQSVRPFSRYKDHTTKFYENPTSPKTLWVKELKELGLKPELEILEVTICSEGGFKEMVWIEKSKGPDLLNIHGHGAFSNKYLNSYQELIDKGLLTLKEAALLYRVSSDVFQAVCFNIGLVFFVEPDSTQLWVSKKLLSQYNTAIRAGIWEATRKNK